MSRWVVFTDVDETLLDRETYSFEAARPALAEIRRRGIPLVLCTSKTAAEILRLQGLLGIREPFVAEDGGGLGLPPGYFRDPPAPAEDRGDHLLVPLAAGREEVLRGLARLRELAGPALRAFSEMSVEEVAGLTRLPPELAALALERRFDEPFLLEDGDGSLLPRLAREAEALGLRLSRGGRFHHLHGDVDKGRAVRRLRGLFEAQGGPLRTLGLGDSPLDLPLLLETDLAVVVRRKDGAHDRVLVEGVPGLRLAPAAGPAGWNAAVLEILAEDAP